MIIVETPSSTFSYEPKDAPQILDLFALDVNTGEETRLGGVTIRRRGVTKYKGPATVRVDERGLVVTLLGRNKAECDRWMKEVESEHRIMWS